MQWFSPMLLYGDVAQNGEVSSFWRRAGVLLLFSHGFFTAEFAGAKATLEIYFTTIESIIRWNEGVCGGAAGVFWEHPLLMAMAVCYGVHRSAMFTTTLEKIGLYVGQTFLRLVSSHLLLLPLLVF